MAKAPLKTSPCLGALPLPLLPSPPLPLAPLPTRPSLSFRISATLPGLQRVGRPDKKQYSSPLCLMGQWLINDAQRGWRAGPGTGARSLRLATRSSGRITRSLFSTLAGECERPLHKSCYVLRDARQGEREEEEAGLLPRPAAVTRFFYFTSCSFGCDATTSRRVGLSPRRRRLALACSALASFPDSLWCYSPANITVILPGN